MKLKLPNGFGSITKLTGNRRNPFMVRKTIGIDSNTGIQQMKIIGYYPKYTEAMQALLSYNETGTTNETESQHTFENVYDAFTAEKFTKAGKDIPSVYRTAYKRCENIQTRLFTSLTLADLVGLMDSIDKPAPKRDMRVMLNQLYKYAMKYDIVDRNLAERIDAIKIEQSDKHQPFTEEEIKVLWNNQDDTICKLWLIYIYTGLRPRELLHITTDNVHLNEQYMIGGMKNEFSKNRMIPIANCILPLVKSIYDPNRKYLIENSKNNNVVFPYRRFMDDVKLFCAKYHMQHIPHDARHTTATLLDQMNVNILITKKILGHSAQKDIGITGKVYIHKTLQDMLDAVNSLPTYKDKQTCPVE